MTVLLNEELAAEAARRPLADRGLSPRDVRMRTIGLVYLGIALPANCPRPGERGQGIGAVRRS